MKQSFIVLVLAITFAIPCSAGIYKWVDDKGETHYSNDPPAGHLVSVESRKEIKRKPKLRPQSKREVVDNEMPKGLPPVRKLKTPGKAHPDKVAFYERYIKITKGRLERYRKELAEIQSETHGNHQEYFNRLEVKRKQVYSEKGMLKAYTRMRDRAKQGL